MGFRVIQGLITAETCPRPDSIPKSRARGRKREGLKYEADLARALPMARHGQWFRFRDRNGPGHCQTDLLLETGHGLAVLESKYTWVWEGHRQLDQLYLPVVWWLLPDRHVFGLVVCKVLTPEVRPDWICRDLGTALSRAADGQKTVLHWVGQSLALPRHGLGPPGPVAGQIPLPPARLSA